MGGWAFFPLYIIRYSKLWRLVMVDPKLYNIKAEEKTPLVVRLIRSIKSLIQENQKLKDEIDRIKNNPKRPRLNPSIVGKFEKLLRTKKRRSPKNKQELRIHKTVKVMPMGLPNGSRILKYRDFVVQELKIQVENIKYKLAVCRTPDGKTMRAKLPSECHGHYGNKLKSYILNFHYNHHVSQRDILASFRSFGTQISSGQVSNILTKKHDGFHKEKQEILEKGLSSSEWVVVDDTGCRQEGKNGFCTHVGNDRFAFFQSSESKSRLNFLNVLQGIGPKEYCINGSFMQYLSSAQFPKEKYRLLERALGRSYENEGSFLECLKDFGITGERNIKAAKEAALIGGLAKRHGQNNKIIVSDAAGQFKIFTHAACWVHKERKINGLLPAHAAEKELLDEALEKFWNYYAELREYKENPSQDKKFALWKKFDTVFSSKYDWDELNAALEEFRKTKQELLIVLDYPHIPLNNNISERDIREVVKKRKISAGTRSRDGTICRDTFLSLKKTCGKLNVQFLDYLQDRLNGEKNIPYLPDLISAPQTL